MQFNSNLHYGVQLLKNYYLRFPSDTGTKDSLTQVELVKTFLQGVMASYFKG